MTLQIVASLTDNSKGVIYTRNVFIIQASGVFAPCKLLYLILFISGKKVADRWNSKSLCNTKKLTEDSSEKVNSFKQNDFIIKIAYLFNLSVLLKNTFLIIKPHVFVVNLIMWHFKLQYHISGTLYNHRQSKNVLLHYP